MGTYRIMGQQVIKLCKLKKKESEKKEKEVKNNKPETM